ncbi:MAG: methyltransferase [Desulfuromonadaceae bacterium]|nr:methyltransferase [Desulfuromonadaceae bacterium]
MVRQSGSCPGDVLHDDETLDELRCGGLQLIQHGQGYRFSLDPVLLVAFASLGKAQRILDLGCGCGVMALIAARRCPDAEVVGLEVQSQQAERAQRNVTLNALNAQVRIDCADLRSWRDARLFDCVLCNPPFRSVASGRVSSGDERSLSRHECCGGLEDFLRCGAHLLGSGGTLALIHLAERAVDVLTGMRRFGVEPKRMRWVHSRSGTSARLVLVEGRRGGRPGLEVESPLSIYEGQEYSSEVAGYYDV